MFWPRYKWMSALFIPTTILERTISHAQRLSTYRFRKTEYGVEVRAIFDIKGYKHACGASFNEFNGRGETRINAIQDCLSNVREHADYCVQPLKRRRESKGCAQYL